MTTAVRSGTQRANVFVVHSPFQYLIVSHMRQNMVELANADNHLILDMSAASVDGTLWDSVITLDPPVGGSVIGAGKRCRQALIRYTDLRNRYAGVDLFISDTDWPLNNALFGLTRTNTTRNDRICNYPDGIGSLLVSYPSVGRRFRNVIKTALGKFGGAPYHLYNGDIMGISVSDRVYTLLPEALKGHVGGDLVGIPMLNRVGQTEISNACIFLGQNYDQYMSEDSYARLCLSAATYVHGLNYERFYYKPHHFATSKIERDIFIEHGFEPVEETGPIEGVFLTRPLACVASYNSSALLHLKLMFGDDVRCIACLSNTAQKSLRVRAATLERLLELFDLCGVERYGD